MAELLNQEEVNYRTAEDGVQSCANCSNFRAPDQCSLVKPPVGAAGVCDLWAKAGNEAELMEMLFGGATPEMQVPGEVDGGEGMY